MVFNILTLIIVLTITSSNFFYNDYSIKYYLNKLEQDVEPAAKALVVSGPMAIFHAGHGKS